MDEDCGIEHMLGGRGEVMTIPKGEKEEGVRGSADITSGPDGANSGRDISAVEVEAKLASGRLR